MNNNSTWPAQVVEILPDGRIVINKGRHDAVKKYDRFIIYKLGKELFDPVTKESLGTLEITKGTGEAVHIQDRLTTIESNVFEEDEEQTRSVFNPLGGQIKKIRKQRSPFKNVTPGDYVKPY